MRPLERVRIYSRGPCRGRSSCRRGRAYGFDASARRGQEAMRNADIVFTTTSAREPIVERVARARERTSMPSARASRRARARRRGDGGRALVVDRRESALNESGDILLAVREGTLAEHIALAEIGEVLIGARRAPGAGRDHAVQVARVGDRGPRRRRVALRGAARGGPRRRGASCDPARSITRARETIAGVAVRTPLVRLARRRAGRDLSQAGEPAADRLVQDPRRDERDGRCAARRARARASSPRARATWRRASRGARASSACRAPSSCPTTRRGRSSMRWSGSAGAS